MFLKMTMMAEEEQQKMHEASLYVLENVGISIGSDDVRDMFEKEGAKVIGENVRFPKEMVEESLSHTVHEFTLGAYKEENRLQVPSTTHPYSTTAGYVPFVYDEETGEDRLATEADLTDVQLGFFTPEGVGGNHTHGQVNDANFPDYREKKLDEGGQDETAPTEQEEPQ